MHWNLRIIHEYLHCNPRVLPFEKLTYHMRVAYINTRVYLNSTLKIYKSILDEISWGLIHNYPNHLNHPNLWNHSISQSINRGLGVGTNQLILERKVMLVVYLDNLGVAELRVLWLQRSPCVRSWFVLLSYSSLVNKDNSSSNLVLSLFHVYWFNE